MSTTNNLRVAWVSRGREASQPADPNYPEGIKITCDALFKCGTALPYPAPCCGLYVVQCDKCGIRVGVTAAGRADDPNYIEVPCKRNVSPDTN